MRRQLAVPTGVAALAVALALGLWLWGRPRADIAMPQATTSPADLVRTYVQALNSRDFSACRQMGVDNETGIGATWATVHAPNVTALSIDHVTRVIPGLRGATAQSDPRLRGWEQTVEVDTTATMHNFDGFHGVEAGQPWSYELVRHDGSEPWRILDQGQG